MIIKIFLLSVLITLAVYFVIVGFVIFTDPMPKEDDNEYYVVISKEKHPRRNKK